MPTQPGQYGPPGYAQQPPAKSGNGLIIGLVVGLAVLLPAGGGVGAYFYLNSSAPTSKIALPSTSPSADRPSAAPSETPSETPSDPTKPSDQGQSAEPGSPLTHNEFDDWNFALGDVKLKAAKVAGWTYNTCDPVDGTGVLAKNKCVRAIELAYTAYNGHLKAVQVMMSFPSEQAAKTAADRLAKLDSDAVKWRKNRAHSSYVYGKIRSGASKKYVVVTIVTADKSAREKASDFHAYLQTDHAGYFLMRDLTITS